MIKEMLIDKKKWLRKYRALQSEALQLLRLNQALNYEPDQWIAQVKSSKNFRPSQKDHEIKFLMDLIRNRQVSTICEIGSYKGGSLALFCLAGSPNLNIISVDINYPLERKLAHKKFARQGQKITCIQGDTQNPLVFEKVKRALGTKAVDLLFIDGDHSLFGVMNDYVRFSPLVKKGGVIVFHDIQPSQDGEDGNSSKTYVGNVPAFWQTLVASGLDTFEFIDDKAQEGYGLGLIYV